MSHAPRSCRSPSREKMRLMPPPGARARCAARSAPPSAATRLGRELALQLQRGAHVERALDHLGAACPAGGRCPRRASRLVDRAAEIVARRRRSDRLDERDLVAAAGERGRIRAPASRVRRVGRRRGARLFTGGVRRRGVGGERRAARSWDRRRRSTRAASGARRDARASTCETGTRNSGSVGKPRIARVVEGDRVAHRGAAHAERGQSSARSPRPRGRASPPAAPTRWLASVALHRLRRHSTRPTRCPRRATAAEACVDADARAPQRRVAAHLRGAKWFGDAAHEEEVDHHLLGGRVERRGLQPQLHRRPAPCRAGGTGAARSRAAPAAIDARGRSSAPGCRPRAGRRARSGAGCRGTATCASSPRRRMAPSVWPSSRSIGVRRLNLISRSRKYVWRIASPGVKVTSSVWAKSRSSSSSSTRAEDRRRVDALERDLAAARAPRARDAADRGW